MPLQVWEAVDTNGDGHLDKSELRQLLEQMGMETVDELDLAIVIADLTDGGADDNSADVDDDVREASLCCGAVLLLVAPCSQSCRPASERVLCVRMSRLRLRSSRGGS